jgi:phosphoribosylformylglycinamidine synthase
MSLGNEIGFETDGEAAPEEFLKFIPGAILAECAKPLGCAKLIGRTIDLAEIRLFGEREAIENLKRIWQAPLESVFPTSAGESGETAEITDTRPFVLTAREKFARPRAVIPVFPGTNCEYDTANAVRAAGGVPETVIIRNLDRRALADSVGLLADTIMRSQLIILPGGFSGGDEPDGSGKFIASLFRNKSVTDAVRELLFNRDGLMLGICNGFQALIKLGLVPFGDITETDESCPTLTFNSIGRHQSRYVTTRVCCAMSPWLRLCEPGELHSVAISHGEGRFIASGETIDRLTANGQIATQYCDSRGKPLMDTNVNPNGSLLCVEGITSPDGRVFGKMGHTERAGEHLALNIAGNKNQPIFSGGIGYFL